MNAPSAVVAWSSGKDAAWTLHQARRAGARVTGLVTTFDEQGRVQGHGVPRALVEAQADALGLELFSVTVEDPSNAGYSAAFVSALDKAGAEEVWFGDISLDDVRAFRENLLEGICTPRFPLWRAEPRSLVTDMLDHEVSALVVCVDTDQAPRNLLGRTLSPGFLAELPPEVDPAGENGEFHTFVCSGPGFTRPIAPRWVDVEDDGRFLRMVLEPGPRRGYGDAPFEPPER
ncbi:MAG TPA: hypothetical protein RMG48_20755 [Myxococcales bacterium LLY-WYZ-16_1]|nr:hypothetical protein [Myxococcales bacterium LLY-WYZ-16_1]